MTRRLLAGESARDARIFWLLSLIDLRFTWFAFPISEVLVGFTGIVLYYKEIKRDFDKGAA